MTQLWRSFSGVIPLVLVAGLVVGTLVAMVSWARVEYALSRTALARSALDGGIAVWTLAVVAITLLPTGAPPIPGAHQAIVLVPLADLTDLVSSSVSWEVPFVQIGGNLLLFAVGGALVALRRSWGVGRVALTFAVLGIGIEATQTLVGGRSAVIDDVLLAVVGATLGAWCVASAQSAPSARTHTSTEDLAQLG